MALKREEGSRKKNGMMNSTKRNIFFKKITIYIYHLGAREWKKSRLLV
jgi:hypothetical protein